MDKRNYNGIKNILRVHIKKNVRSLWTFENDNFTWIYENYSGDSRIYTSQQMLKFVSKLCV